MNMIFDPEVGGLIEIDPPELDELFVDIWDVLDWQDIYPR